jgi:hypothetical protein
VPWVLAGLGWGVARAKIVEEVEKLVGGWCDRRSLRALRAILSGWPLSSGPTDDWGNLLDALEKVRAFGTRWS